MGVGAGRTAVKGGANDGQSFTHLCLPSVLRRPHPPESGELPQRASSPAARSSRSTLSIRQPKCLACSPRRHRPAPRRRGDGQAGTRPAGPRPKRSARPAGNPLGGRDPRPRAAHARPYRNLSLPAPRGLRLPGPPPSTAGRGGAGRRAPLGPERRLPGRANSRVTARSPGPPAVALRPRPRLRPGPSAAQVRRLRSAAAALPRAQMSHLRARRSARTASAGSTAGVQRRPDLSALAPPRSGPALVWGRGPGGVAPKPGRNPRPRARPGRRPTAGSLRAPLGQEGPRGRGKAAAEEQGRLPPTPAPLDPAPGGGMRADAGSGAVRPARAHDVCMEFAREMRPRARPRRPSAGLRALPRAGPAAAYPCLSLGGQNRGVHRGSSGCHHPWT